MMKLKRAAALLLCAVMLVSFAACRTENENAVSYTDSDGNTYGVRSALYILYAMDTMSEYQTEYAKQTTTTTAAETATDTTTTTTVNYNETKLENKSYNEWVQDKALESCAEYAYVESEFKKASLSFTDDQTTAVTNTVDQYWSSNKNLYEQNGIAKTTLKLYVENKQKREALFNHYYGDGGSKEVKTDAIKKYLKDNCLLVQFISYSLYSYDSSGQTKAVSDTDKTEYKSLLESYATRLNAGGDYAAIRAEYFNKINQKDTVSVEGSKAKYPYAMVMGDAESSINPFEKFDEIKALEIGKSKFVETSSMYAVMQRVDLNADLDYCAEQNATNVRHELKDDEYDSFLSENASKLTADKNSGALNTYRASKLKLKADEK